MEYWNGTLECTEILEYWNDTPVKTGIIPRITGMVVQYYSTEMHSSIRIYSRHLIIISKTTASCVQTVDDISVDGNSTNALTFSLDGINRNFLNFCFDCKLRMVRMTLTVCK